MCVVVMFEISKHSMWRGGAVSCSASCSAARSATGTTVLGTMRSRPRVYLRVCLVVLAQVVEHVAQLRRTLEIELLRGLFHFVLQRLEHFVRAALEELARRFHALAVLLRRNVRELHRHLIGGGFQLALGRVAAAEGEDAEFLAHEGERLAERPGVREGAEVARAFIGAQAREAEAGPLVAQIDLHQEEAFVVAEADVVARTEFLDEPALEQQRLGLASSRCATRNPRSNRGARGSSDPRVMIFEGMKYCLTRLRRLRALPT